MRKHLKLSALFAASAMGVLAALGPADAQTKLRVAGNFPDEHTATKAMTMFKEEVARLTNNEITVDTFPAMQLGGAQENVDQVRSGTIFAVVASIAYFSRTVPELEALSLPFQFDSRKKAFEVVDGPIGDEVNEKMLAKGFMSLGFGEIGFRHITNSKHPIASVADLKDMKIRLQPNEVHLATFKALGANPVAMDVKELYSALETGVLDGQENPYGIILTRRFDEVQKYLSNTGHFFDFTTIVANKRAFEKLSPEHQKAVREAMKKSLESQRAEEERQDLEYREKLVANGMEYTELSPEARAAMQDATKSVVENLKKRIDAGFVDRVLAAGAK